MRSSPQRRVVAAAGVALGVVLIASQAPGEPAARQEPIPDQVWRAMQGKSWRASLPCPSRNRLALVTVPFLDFSGQSKMGQLIVARSLADDVMAIFTEIFASGKFRIQRMELIEAFGGDDDASMAANNTSAFNCRRVPGTASMSAHALGAAIDINPIQNPFVTRAGTFPPAGKAFDEPRERARDVVGLIRPGDVVTAAFKKRGWRWGGDFRSMKDYQHFSRGGH